MELLILLLIGVWVFFALRSCRRKKGCCGNCTGCSGNCKTPCHKQ